MVRWTGSYGLAQADNPSASPINNVWNLLPGEMRTDDMWKKLNNSLKDTTNRLHQEDLPDILGSKELAAQMIDRLIRISGNF